MAQVQEPDPRLRDQSMGELFKQLSDDMSKLVRQELKLAQAEMTEKGKKAGSASACSAPPRSSGWWRC